MLDIVIEHLKVPQKNKTSDEDFNMISPSLESRTIASFRFYHYVHLINDLIVHMFSTYFAENTARSGTRSSKIIILLRHFVLEKFTIK